MRVTILGSGTSHGVPVVGCECDVCRSKDPKDTRTRSSILVEHEGAVILVDTSTDFRFQALREGIRRIDAVLMTHAHADHLLGLDDTRSLSRARPLPLYGSPDTLREIRKRFDYAFKQTQVGGGKPNIDLRALGHEPRAVAGIDVVPVPIKHGDLDIYGFRFGKFAYITDCSRIPDESVSLLSGVETLVIGALRYRPHATHFTIEEAIAASDVIGASRVWFTHICHDVCHKSLVEELSRRRIGPTIQPGYDGLVITV